MKILAQWTCSLAYALALVSMALPAAAQSTPEGKTYPALKKGKIHRLDPRFDKLVPKEAVIEQLAEGFEWSEGPVWVQGGGYLLFSDIPRNEILKWKEGEGISRFLRPAGYTGDGEYGLEPGTNGLALDSADALIACEHGNRRISRLDKSGVFKTTLADKYDGKRFNSPNDLTYRANGDLYFTDPPYGLPKNFDDPRRELPYCGVYRLASDGKVTLLTEKMTRPNGLAFSPDQKTLYVAQSDPKAAVWMKYAVKEDGTLEEGKLFYDATSLVGPAHKGLPDGLKVDAEGNLFATGPGGVLVFAPDATLIGRIETGENTANVAWGNDGSALYITADMFLCRVKTSTKGAGWKAK